MVVRFAGITSVILGALFTVSACGSAAPPKPAGPVVEETPEPQSSEWLYATKGLGSSDVTAECEHVRAALKDESKCNGEVCAYASRLSEDWLRRCKKADPAGLDEVTQLAREYDTRKGGARVPCMRDIEQILDRGCSGDPKCAEVVQEWTTRCSDEAGSPLVVRILETRLMQAASASGAVRLDKRGCKELAADISSAGNCAQRFQCEDALPAVDTYRKRCLNALTLPGLHEGLAELSVRVGAGQKPEPVAIQPDSPALDPKRFAVTLADGSGIVVLVCGERPTDLDSYLGLRRDCAEGEVVVVQRQPGRAKGTLRVGYFAQPSDDVFARNYPSLAARGETAARSAAGLTRLAAALGPIAERASGGGKYDPELLAAVIGALGKEASALRVAEDRSALAQRDEQLAPLFKALGKAKVDAARSIFKPLENATFVRRSVRRPLADVDADGNVSSGAMNAAGSLDLAKLLPKSLAAYQAELGGFHERLRSKTLSATHQATVNDQLAQALNACAAAQGKVLESEGALVECGFGAACEPELLEELGTELTNARIDGTVAQLKVLLAGDSLDAPPTASDKGPRCVEPWW